MTIFCSFDDSGVQRIQVRGKPVYFTFSYRFGPLITTSKGDPLDRQPASDQHPFWEPFSKWFAEWKVTHPDPSLKPNARAQFNRDPQP